jgi:hypothetical protein
MAAGEQQRITATVTDGKLPRIFMATFPIWIIACFEEENDTAGHLQQTDHATSVSSVASCSKILGIDSSDHIQYWLA